jgi:hypothetical protein
VSQNLNREEIAKWKETCKRQRDIARCNPCTEIPMTILDDFGVRLGPWSLRLFLAAYMKPPMWQGSVCLIKTIGDELVYGADGVPIFEVPKEGIVCVDDWTQEDYSEARDLLGDLFGPLINHPDQKVMEGSVKGGMALTWLTSNKDANQRIDLVRI